MAVYDREDQTVYKIILDRDNELGVKELKAVSTVARCNYIQAISLMARSPYKMIEGIATDIENYIEMLNEASVKYHIEPEWPYNKSRLEPGRV